jgi:hypothetical protein
MRKIVFCICSFLIMVFFHNMQAQINAADTTIVEMYKLVKRPLKPGTTTATDSLRFIITLKVNQETGYINHVTLGILPNASLGSAPIKTLVLTRQNNVFSTIGAKIKQLEIPASKQLSLEVAMPPLIGAYGVSVELKNSKQKISQTVFAKLQ